MNDQTINHQPSTITIVVPMRNEEAFIAACLASLRAQDYPADLLDILVYDGESTDRSAEIVADIAREDPRVRLLPNPRRLQATAMNLALQDACGDIIIRADAHATYGPTYVSTCVNHLAAGRAENVGGLQRGAGTTAFSRAVAAALNTALGAGNAAYRTATEMRYTDTVWLGAWYKKTLVDLGGFREDMAANEDYELNCRLHEHGGRILLDPSLSSTYYARTSPAHLWRQYFRYGQSKVQTLKLHPDSLLPRQFAVPAFLLLLIVVTALISLTPLPLLILGSLYLLAVFASSLRSAASNGWLLFPLVVLAYPIMHFAWGLGFFWGCVRYRGFPLRLRRVFAQPRRGVGV
ncbi:MAG: glycosyltransferase family 2 protein [Armatimonadota bacterium]